MISTDCLILVSYEILHGNTTAIYFISKVFVTRIICQGPTVEKLKFGDR